MSTEVIAPFADGEYRFWLPLPRVESFERDHGSMLDFYGKLGEATALDANGNFLYVGPSGPPTKAILDFVRQALIGGGTAVIDGKECEVGPVQAKALVADYCFPARPLDETAALAFRIAHTAVRGIELKGSKKKGDETSDPSDSARDS